MSENPAPKETIAFFGATGGCGLAALSLALRKGYTCTALARTPAKLTVLLAARAIPESTLTTRLHITAGSSKDPAAVLAALTTADPADPAAPPSRPVDLVVTSVGGKPQFWPHPLRPRLDDPDVCGASAQVLVDAVAALPYGARPGPLVVAVSTTGLPSAPVRDVPLLLLPLYRIMLHWPHVDKEHMEAVLGPGEGRVAAVVVRASLLTNGKAKGVGKVREGVEGSPAVGYTISREDVGAWIVERVVENPARKEEWAGKKVTITY